jgi:hypothetical protein
MQPVLIDFGLARREGATATTIVATDCAAPEVRQPEPRWSKAADVFGVAMTLCALLAGPGKTLKDALRPFLSPSEADRPPMSKLRAVLDELRARQRVAETVTRLFSERVDVYVSIEKAPWLAQVVEKFHARFEASFLNVHPDERDCAANAADFLNQALEAWSRPRGEALALKAAAENWGEEDLRLAAALRNDGAHFRRGARLGNRTPRQVVESAARFLNTKLGTMHLQDLAGAFFAPA